jgi:hypothetical protein
LTPIAPSKKRGISGRDPANVADNRSERLSASNPPARERLLLIVSAAGQPPSLKLIAKSEVVIGYWTGDSFQLMPGWRPPLNWRPAVTHWARLASCLPEGTDLIHEKRFDPDVSD